MPGVPWGRGWTRPCPDLAGNLAFLQGSQRMTGRVLVLLTRSLLAAATTVAVLATPASATADGSDGLSGELLTLDLSGLSTCEPGATSHSFTATGDATGPVAGPVEAT